MTTGIKVMLFALIGIGLGVAKDSGAAVFKMYWTDDLGVLRRADSSGTNVQDVLTGVHGSPYAIAIDDSRGKMYYSELAGDASGFLMRANLDGSGVTTLASRSAKPQDIALDLFGGKIYWAEGTITPGEFTISRANLDGSGAEDLITGLSIVRGLALAAGKIYWTDEGTRKIQRANFDGTNVEDVITGLQIPDDVAFELVTGKLYFTDAGTNMVRRASFDGTSVENLITGLVDPEGIALDVAGGKVYFLENSGAKVRRANLDGTGLEDLVTTGLLLPRRIALQFDYEGCHSVGPDTDGDGEVEATDRCPGTPPGELVDDAGCSGAQFCAQFDATTRDGARACKEADWRNDEPVMRVSTGADCVIDKGTLARKGKRCVPAP